jgi:hypothetical protein
MASKDHSISVYLRVECKSLQAHRVTAGVTATLQSCNHLQLLGLRLGAWPAAVCISVAARHVRAHRIHWRQLFDCNQRVGCMNSANFDSQVSSLPLKRSS